MLKPLADRVIVKFEEEKEEKTVGGLILTTKAASSSYATATVVACGAGKVASRISRFLLKFCYSVIFICYQYTESAGLFHRNRHCCNRDIRIACLMVVEHNLVIHLINMVA